MLKPLATTTPLVLESLSRFILTPNVKLLVVISATICWRGLEWFTKMTRLVCDSVSSMLL